MLITLIQIFGIHIYTRTLYKELKKNYHLFVIFFIVHNFSHNVKNRKFYKKLKVGSSVDGNCIAMGEKKYHAIV